MIEKKKVLKSVTILFDRNAVDVQWSIQFLENDTVSASVNEASSYTQDRKDELLAEVEGAEHYIAALGW